MQHAPEHQPLDSVISPHLQRVIAQAARLAHEGKHAEAEATRFGAGYHNMESRLDPDTVS